MTIDFYYIPGSPPCSVVSLVISSLGIESKVKSHAVNMMANDQMKPEYLKLNPQHTAPTIVDDGFSLWESRAISKYLVGKFGEKLYPSDLKTRAIIDQRLDFDLGTLYSRFGDYYYTPFFTGTPVDENKLGKLQEALGMLDTFLISNKYAAGANLTLADYSLGVTVSMIEAANISIEKYSNIIRWYALVKSTIPKFEEVNGKYVNDFKQVFEMLSKSK